ncbi:MAG TPA: hypothetical protein GX708_06910 [Gallicola sp.]|nr:hypothetical protein [Gallicola sp.]
MIVENQSNIKVHFAGAEQTDFAYCISKGGNINYYLFSVFYFINKVLGLKNSGFRKGIPIYKELEYFNSKHSIMDSGLFTLMFGAHAGKRTEFEIDTWFNALTEFVLKEDIKSTCVEVDCQKILGVEKAWDLRIKMKEILPNNRIINVFHKEDGKKGLDRLIEFSDYIAISVPELRAIGQKKYTYNLAHYIKNKKPSIDIHLLGCTEIQLLKDLNFCPSADSTTWQQLNRYGSIKGYSIKNIKQQKINEKYQSIVIDMCKRYDIEITQRKIDYYSRYCFTSDYYKKLYTKEAGNQD